MGNCGWQCGWRLWQILISNRYQQLGQKEDDRLADTDIRSAVRRTYLFCRCRSMAPTNQSLAESCCPLVGPIYVDHPDPGDMCGAASRSWSTPTLGRHRLLPTQSGQSICRSEGQECVARSSHSRMTAHRKPNVPSHQLIRCSDFRLLRKLQGVLHLDAEVTYRAFKLGVAQQQLHGTNALGAAVNQ